MARTQGSGFTLGACLLQLATLILASPLKAKPVAERNHASSTTTTTTWLKPTTVTVNPRDPTITRDAGWTTTTGPPPFTSTITSSCITFDWRYPPEGHEPTVSTATVTARSTITVTDTDRPLQTQYEFYLPTVTVTTPLATYVSYHCLNTLVVQYHDWEYLTWTWSNFAHTATTTGLCVTTSTRSTTIPGVTLPSPPPRPLEDWEYFSVPGVSVVTKHTVAIATDTSVVFPGTTTRTVCDSRNPHPTITTPFTIHRPSTTVTATETVTEACADKVRRQGGSGTGEGSRVYPPVEVRTVVYTTVTVIDNTVSTLTGTAIVDINTQQFPVTRVAYTTVAGTSVATVTETVCA
ncbi:predicted protein [Chaetomium globosum CBS 148.51]|uniref:Uncharacterized protein n=1 Tax=Chaetomium globosum (strain ATCC 6205 / CBS 148.51 / DSM 1962 / NBRC 6347 / NRRL 1970) TaxID=306901 RepID=Q2GWK3_CHAGB|nr:uncharacterized protein CHGG_07651 [Chaetomium globosum CBS 148.51]EAQ86398.1 predicted protein [Chaetomium globosum CBS 148.51]